MEKKNIPIHNLSKPNPRKAQGYIYISTSYSFHLSLFYPFFFFEIISHFFNNHLLLLILPQPPRNLFPPKHAALNCENVFKSHQEFRGTQFHTNKRALRLESISKEVDNSIIQHSIGQLGLSGVRYNLDQSLCVWERERRTRETRCWHRVKWMQV